MTQPTVNYVVALFLGPRRTFQISDPIGLIKRHLDRLDEYRTPIDRLTIVLNSRGDEDVARLKELLDDYYSDFYVEIKLIVRENTGLSYGAWQEAVDSSIEAGEEFDYFFLFEDDYAPAHPDFLDIYLERMADDVCYVCQKLSHVTLSKIFGTQIHAGISCGLLKGKAAREAHEKFGSAIHTFDESVTYDWLSVQAQVHFLDHVMALGYGITDASDVSSVPFVHEGPKDEWPPFFLMEYGNPEGIRYIEPTVEWRLFR